MGYAALCGVFSFFLKHLLVPYLDLPFLRVHPCEHIVLIVPYSMHRVAALHKQPWLLSLVTSADYCH